MRVHPAVLLASLLGSGLLLAGCSHRQTRPSPSGHASVSSASAHTTHAHSSRTSNGASSRPLPKKTGIPACDDYLASYRACHRAAHIFPADTIQSHYELMRKTLLEQSRDPQQRKILPARCKSLNKLMRQALHGKSCDVPTGTAGSPAGGRSS